MPAVTGSLDDIRTKFRRLTRSPSENQISTPDIDNYINTFLMWDFPEHLRTFNYRQQFTFICNPYQDLYNTDTLSFAGVTTNPLYNFQNKYLTVHPPVYIAGFDSLFTQSREQFFGIYPQLNSIAQIGQLGDGVTTTFTGVVNTAQSSPPPNFNQNVTLLQNNVLFSSIDTNLNGLSLVDVPVVSTVTGNPTVNGNLYDPSALPATPPTVVNPANTINYFTGAFTITFAVAPGSGQLINSQTVPSITALPQAMLFYEDQFTLRPVPDQPYRINFEVYVVPTALMETAGQNMPQLTEYWQYIAYGAAKKRFEDQMDLDSVQLILPEYRKQENLVLRRTIVQNTNERVATIYTEQTNFGNGYSNWGNANGAF